MSTPSILRTIMALGLALFLVAACQAKTEEAKEQQPQPQVDQPGLGSPAAKLSYAFGMQVGQSLKGLETEIDLEAFSRAVGHMLTDASPELTEEEAGMARQEFLVELQKKQIEKLQKLAEDNKKEGEAFLAANKGAEGVTTTESGLQYKVLAEGDGAIPTAEDTVTVHYKGTLLDGNVFDSSYERNEPVTLPLAGVIPGWTEALQLMKAGSKYMLYIPAELAYGESGAGNRIPPNAVLQFEVELLSIGEPEVQEEIIEPEPAEAAPPAAEEAK